MLRKIICAVFTVVMIFTLSGCEWLLLPIIIEQSNDIKSKEEIIAFVQENRDKLLASIKQRQPETLEGFGIIKSVYEGGNYIEYYCGGSGFGSQTNYSGFIYAKNGNINAARSDISLDAMVEKDDGYYWHDEVGDNTYFVVHICDRFFYYYEHY